MYKIFPLNPQNCRSHSVHRLLPYSLKSPLLVFKLNASYCSYKKNLFNSSFQHPFKCLNVLMSPLRLLFCQLNNPLHPIFPARIFMNFLKLFCVVLQALCLQWDMLTQMRPPNEQVLTFLLTCAGVIFLTWHPSLQPAVNPQSFST